MRGNLARMLGGLVLVCALPLAAQQSREEVGQDLLKLKNGREFKGRLVEATDERVTFEFRGSEIVLPRRLVEEIVRGERLEVEAAAEQAPRELSSHGRFEERDAFYFVYYRGKRVGWRQRVLAADPDRPEAAWRFEARTVFRKEDGSQELDLRVTEAVDRELRPRNVSVFERGEGHDDVRSGSVDKGHLHLELGAGAAMTRSEVLFTEETELLMPLLRRLADATHVPEKGREYKVFDPVREEFFRVHARREVRKEVVGGKQQFVTVWQLESGERSWEVWFDGHGGIVREELGSPHMVAVRAPKDDVLAWSRGEGDMGDPELALEFESEPLGFRIVSPNLTWSRHVGEDGSAQVLALVNPTLQASTDVIALDDVGRETEPETVLLEVLDRLRRGSEDLSIEYQKPDAVGGRRGIRFETVSDRKGVRLRTLGAVCCNAGRAFAVLMAAPEFRFREARPQFERILGSFEVTGTRAAEPSVIEF